MYIPSNIEQRTCADVSSTEDMLPLTLMGMAASLGPSPHPRCDNGE